MNYFDKGFGYNESFDFDYSNNPLYDHDKSLGDKFKSQVICKTELYYDGVKEFGIYRVETTHLNKNFVIKGNFPEPLTTGQSYKVKGVITEFRDERQLAIKEIYPCRPVNKKGIIAYLKTLHGLKFRAEEIYSVFGDESINVLIKDPMAVAKQIRGIGKKSVLKWQEQLKDMEETQYTYMKLLGYGISESSAKELVTKYGDAIIARLEDNPYLLIKEVKGYSFLKCDRIALEDGLEPNSHRRIQAGILYVLDSFSKEGNAYCPYDKLIKLVNNKISLTLSYKEMCSLYQPNANKTSIKYKLYETEYIISIKDLKEHIDLYINADNKDRANYRYKLYDIKADEIEAQLKLLLADREIYFDRNKVYLKKLYENEVYLAEKIKNLTVYYQQYPIALVNEIVDEICKEKGIILEEEQRKACVEFNLYKSGLFILNGSAGTGKTFTLKLILEVGKRVRQRMVEKNAIKKTLLVAPTGKASKVASKATEHPCLTVHKALIPEKGMFTINENNPFLEKVIICDESGMLDINLGKSFFEAVSNDSKLILMGDIKQLPSVGPGSLLKDLLECSFVKVVTLNVPKRQGLLSGINYNANIINDNKMISTSLKTKDFYVLQKNDISSVKDSVIKSIQRLLTTYKYNFEDIQVLIPQRTGSLGTNMINYCLQQYFNADGLTGNKLLKGTFEARPIEKAPIQSYNIYFCVGDKVIHTQNDYEMKLYEKKPEGFVKLDRQGITNGECGIIYDIIISKNDKNKEVYKIIVKYDDYYAMYDSMDSLELAYALTIHKSQGSAWKAIILLIVPQHISMLTRNILYTGITRARDFCAVIGSNKAIKYSIGNTVVMNRYSGLPERLAN